MDLDFKFLKIFWTMVGVSFKNSRLDWIAKYDSPLISDLDASRLSVVTWLQYHCVVFADCRLSADGRAEQVHAATEQAQVHRATKAYVSSYTYIRTIIGAMMGKVATGDGVVLRLQYITSNNKLSAHFFLMNRREMYLSKLKLKLSMQVLRYLGQHQTWS